jgi:hypothetical protein
MKTRIKFFLMFFASMIMALGAFGSLVQGAQNRPTISTADRALAMWEVQNTMSKHAYYHAAGMHLEELADIWVSETGPYASTATFASPGWIMKGVAAVKKYYGQVNQDNKVKKLEAVSRLYPEIKNTKENLGVGHEYAMHANTTPIIEIAGDGRTAKGIWYSPGIGLSARIQGNDVIYGGTFFWEKYGADFVKEDGKWKIWHCQMFYDWTPSFPESMTSSIGGRQGAPGGPPASSPDGQGGQDAASEGAIEAGERMSAKESSDMVDNPNKYQPYSIKRVPSITPRFPEPYYTFSETFSY